MGTGSGYRETRPHPRALPRTRTTWAKSARHVYFEIQTVCRCPAASFKCLYPQGRDGLRQRHRLHKALRVQASSLSELRFSSSNFRGLQTFPDKLRYICLVYGCPDHRAANSPFPRSDTLLLPEVQDSRTNPYTLRNPRSGNTWPNGALPTLPVRSRTVSWQCELRVFYLNEIAPRWENTMPRAGPAATFSPGGRASVRAAFQYWLGRSLALPKCTNAARAKYSYGAIPRHLARPVAIPNRLSCPASQSTYYQSKPRAAPGGFFLFATGRPQVS